MCLELQSKKLLFWKNDQRQDALDGFSHLAYAGVRESYAGVRESVRTQDLSHEGHTTFMTCRYLGTTKYRYLNACDCMYWHCMLLIGGE